MNRNTLTIVACIALGALLLCAALLIEREAMKALLSYPDNERRATAAGVNLFFSALLGANVGMMNDMPLNDYFKMMVLLTGAVTAIFTIAVSERRPGICGAVRRRWP